MKLQLSERWVRWLGQCKVYLSRVTTTKQSRECWYVSVSRERTQKYKASLLEGVSGAILALSGIPRSFQMDTKSKKAELEALRAAAVAKLAEVKAETTDVD